ncbi:MAG: type II toxin-antitoxin system HicB family antitoxin [Candidatus Aenigmarchaeota archaeon]|nr:type II toxin-antitoxin system HicB family antitoxin [Candidatus Aenigmarchaeota archaeon]
MLEFKKKKFCVAIEKDKDGYYFAYVPSLPGCFTQAKTPNKLIKYVKEVLVLCLYDNKSFKGDDFVGIQIVEV